MGEETPGRNFPHRQRLRLKRDFDRAFREGAGEADSNLVVYEVENSLGYSRLGMVVTKKQGGAVRRNRIRRLIREAFRFNRDKLPASADVVVVARTGMAADLRAIEASLIELAVRAARRKEKRS